MIIIPERQEVVILVPRTGSGTIWRAVKARYAKSFMPYRHMEADGVPIGYDRWRRIGVLRHPVDRLWSLYNFCKTFDVTADPMWNRFVRRSVERPFEDWLFNNARLFAPAYGFKHAEDYDPWLAQTNPLPENRKSQYHYLRPDLGTDIWQFRDLNKLLVYLDVHKHLDAGQRTVHATTCGPVPALSPMAADYAERMFRWDLKCGGYRVTRTGNVERSGQFRMPLPAPPAPTPSIASGGE